MTTKEADRLINSGKPVTVKDAYGEFMTAIFVKRDRRNIETSDGGLFNRADLTIVE